MRQGTTEVAPKRSLNDVELQPLRSFHYFGAFVIVVVFWPSPSTLTLSLRLLKIKACPVTVPCAGSINRGGSAAVPVNTKSPVSFEYTSCSPIPRRPAEETSTFPREVMRS